MRVLRNIVPTDEQLLIINRGDPGHLVVRGAAGSGKTTSALHRLRFITRRFVERHERLQIPGPITVLVLTFNNTLKTYIAELTRSELEDYENVSLDISTFALWAQTLTGLLPRNRVSKEWRRERIAELGAPLRLSVDFLVEEVDYVLGRFLPEDLDRYVDPKVRRVGRGTSPRFDRATLVEQVIRPYGQMKIAAGLHDWNDLAVAASRIGLPKYDIVIADEVQDLSANEIRAINAHLLDTHSVTFILDQAQQIYARGFAWQDVGMNITAANSRRLAMNHRNTRQIAAFATPVLRGLDLTDDGTVPDLTLCREGDFTPLVLRGRYRNQIDRAIELLEERLGEGQTAAFMHPKGMLDEVKTALDRAGIEWVAMTSQKEWPPGDEQVGLVTLHSAKGLEFDHVFLLGLNARFTTRAGDDGEDSLETLRRLFGMAIMEARESVVVGYLPAERSPVIDFLAPGTFDEIEV